MTDATTDPIKIDGHYADVYYDTECRPRAQRLQETIATKLGIEAQD